MSHEHQHEHDFVAANQKHFDSEAKAFDAKPSVIELARRVTKAMVERYPKLFDEEKTTVLDFACGTGVLSRAMCPHVKSIVGVDISQGMIDQFNLRADQQGITSDEMRAIRVDLTVEPEALGGQKFDLVVCSASYHHFDDISEMTNLLAKYVAPGGSLFVADILKEQRSEGEPALLEHFKHVVAHPDGFSEEEMRAVFAGAGLTDFEFVNATKATVHSRDVSIFLAKGSPAVA